MLFRLLLLFTLLPLVELTLLWWVANHTSWQFTVGLVLLTGITGAWLARWQGWQTARRIQEELAEGHMPADRLMDGVLILIAGVVLITPGILTDAFGFVLLIPPLRELIKKRIKSRLKRRFSFDAFGENVMRPDKGIDDDDDDVVEGHVVRRPPDSMESNRDVS